MSIHLGICLNKDGSSNLTSGRLGLRCHKCDKLICKRLLTEQRLCLRFEDPGHGRACAHGKLCNNVVRGKNVAAHVTILAITNDSGLNLSNFLPRYDENAVLVLLVK